MIFNFDYPCVWDVLKNEKKPIILYGMGDGADKVLCEFQKRDIKVSGVFASDDFVRYQNFRGFTVKKQSDIDKEFPDYTVALCFASSLPNVMEHIEKVAKEHTLLVPNVPVFDSEIIDDTFIEKYKKEIEKAYSLLCDEKSKEVFSNVLSFLYAGRLSYLKSAECDKDEIFESVLKLENEVYLDLGAYRGDTVDEFLHYTDGYRKIVAVEPNEKNYIKLTEHIESLDNAVALNCAIGDEISTAYISKGSGRQAKIGDTGQQKVDVMTVDKIAEKKPPTYIKADVEGMESDMLKGAEKTLLGKPKLNIAAYHKSTDFFKLILQINELNPNYKIYIRKHPYIPCWDLNIYCV